MIRRSNGVAESSESHLASRRGQPLDACYQSLVGRLRGVDNGAEQPPQTVGIVRCAGARRRSPVSVNLAITAARLSGEPVLLVDTDVDDPMVRGRNGLKTSPGFSDALFGVARTEDCLQGTRVENLSFMAAGSTECYLRASFEPGHVAALLDALKKDFGLVVVDLATASDSSNSLVPPRVLDGVLLVVEAEQTRIETAQRVKNQLTSAHANLLGVVLNNRQNHLPE